MGSEMCIRDSYPTTAITNDNDTPAPLKLPSSSIVTSTPKKQAPPRSPLLIVSRTERRKLRSFSASSIQSITADDNGFVDDSKTSTPSSNNSSNSPSKSQKKISNYPFDSDPSTSTQDNLQDVENTTTSNSNSNSPRKHQKHVMNYSFESDSTPTASPSRRSLQAVVVTSGKLTTSHHNILKKSNNISAVNDSGYGGGFEPDEDEDNNDFEKEVDHARDLEWDLLHQESVGRLRDIGGR